MILIWTFTHQSSRTRFVTRRKKVCISISELTPDKQPLVLPTDNFTGSSPHNGLIVPLLPHLPELTIRKLSRTTHFKSLAH